MDFKKLSSGFFKKIENQKTSGSQNGQTKYNSDGNISFFGHTDEFAEYVVNEIDLGTGNTEKSINKLKKFKLTDGQLVNPNAKPVRQGAYEDTIVGVINNLLKDDTFANFIDRNENGTVDEKDLLDFYDAIKVYDNDDNAISLEDISTALQDIKNGEFLYAEERKTLEAAKKAARKAVKEAESKNNSTTTSTSSTSTYTSTSSYQTYSSSSKSLSDIDFDFEVTLSATQEYEMTCFKENWKKNKARYKAIEEKTGIPAELIAAIHWRESSGNFNTYLHNGDPLGQPTTHVPAGIYFETWEEAAIDAISNHGTGANSVDPNDIKTYYEYAERYNGLGYRNMGLPSPYIWTGTNNYTCGKYVADGVYSATAVDNQLGVAVMLKELLGS